MKNLLKTVLAAGLSLVAGALSPAAADEALTRVNVAYDGFTMTSAPIQYTLAKGLFKKRGLDVNLVYVEGGSVLTQALVGGSIDIAQNGYTPSIAAAVAGADIAIIGSMANKLPFQLVVDGSIQNADQLRGKSIAISKFGSSTDTALKFALKSLGLEPTDVNVLQLGGEGTRAAAYESRQVQGLMSQYPRTQEIVDAGSKMLVDVTEIVKDYPNTAYVTSRNYLSGHPDVVKRFFMAMGEGLHGFRANPQDAMEVTASFLKLEKGPSVEQAFRFYSEKVYPQDLRPSMPGVAAVLAELSKTLPAAASVKPESIVDTTTLDALDSEGFFKALD
ncbi:ABC transporter substrate-binding protein [Ensifer sp. IC3342]|nr:ABC transporter substrate-binding protein [Ensifer sp. BRP08]MCA1447017.1 ABC transporter substrate-binding protein [Ensifer sp. IC3342]